MLGADLNLTCVAVGSPMPYVKWRKGPAQELTPDDNLPVGINTLELTNIQESANYTCVAASSLGVIETIAQVKVQCKYITFLIANNFLFCLFYLCCDRCEFLSENIFLIRNISICNICRKRNMVSCSYNGFEIQVMVKS